MMCPLEVNDATNLGMINEEISSLKGVKSAEQGGAGVETLVKNFKYDTTNRLDYRGHSITACSVFNFKYD